MIITLDGGWTDWGGWSNCTKTCGGGFKTRDRGCTNPAPSISGKYCEGKSQDVAACIGGKCPGKVHTFDALIIKAII